MNIMDKIINCRFLIVLLIGGPIEGQGCTDSEISVNLPTSRAEEGTSLRMICVLICDPGAEFTYEWYRNEKKVFTYNHATKEQIPDYDLVDRSFGELANLNHVLNITSLSISDDGSWKCRILTPTVAEGKDVGLTISVTPIPAKISITGQSAPLAGTEAQYICSVERMKPQLNVEWFLDGNEISGNESEYTNNEDGTIKLRSFCYIGIDIVQAYILMCSLDNGGTPIQKEFNIDAMGPATIEGMTGSEGEVDSTEPLHITCTASGTNVGIKWYLNDTEITKDYISSATVDGSFKFGQKKGLESNISLELPGTTSTCEQIQYYNGDYTCRASAAAGTLDSQKKSVVLKYSPRGLTTGNTIKGVKMGEPVDIECPVCGYPSVHTFTWTVESGSKPSGVTGWDTDTLTIDQVEDVHFNYKYICTAENDIGQNNVTIVLAIDESVDAQNIGAIVGGVLAGVIVCGAAAGGGGYMYYKHKQKGKDEEVAAYAESGNQGGVNNVVNATNGGDIVVSAATASPVYAEVNKDKKKKSKKNNAAPVYSEVDKDKKKKPNATEHTGQMYCQTNKPGRPLPLLQRKPSSGSTNTGPIYSEVNKPKQGRLTPIEAKRQCGGNEYEEAGYIGGKSLPPINTKHYDNSGQRNEHGGLHYADVDFLRQGNGTQQTHGTKNPSYEPTEYAQIDHRKSAGIVV